MRKLYIDFDGVIYNSIDVSYKMANEKNMKSEKEFYLFYKNLDWQVVLENSCEINNAFSNIKKLCEFDYVQNLIEWKDAGGIGIKFDLDMDGKGFPVIDRLDKVTEILK